MKVLMFSLITQTCITQYNAITKHKITSQYNTTHDSKKPHHNTTQVMAGHIHTLKGGPSNVLRDVTTYCNLRYVTPVLAVIPHCYLRLTTLRCVTVPLRLFTTMVLTLNYGALHYSSSTACYLTYQHVTALFRYITSVR